MYSHDGFGLGQYRRLLKLSDFLCQQLPKVSILLITGSPMAHGFRIPPGVDYVKLPCVAKEDNEVYTAKYLPLEFKEIKSMRERIVLETALGYDPHLFLVDKHPLGMSGEVLPALQALKEHRSRTKVVLGMRDILDDSRTMVPYFRNRSVAHALEEIYDEIWVYGCQSIYDPIREYMLTDTVTRKIKFCGYIPTERPTFLSAEVRRRLKAAEGKFALITAGSGEDGFFLLDTYLKALDPLSKDLEIFSLLVTGPEMPLRQRRDLKRRCMRLPSSQRVDLLQFCPKIIEYMSAADVIVSMGGYNTLSELISLGKEAVVVPRVSPRKEQLIRAAAFEKRDVIRMIHPEHLSPKALAETVYDALQTPTLPFTQRLKAAKVDLNGLESVKNHVAGLLSSQNGE